jgi:thioredoxin 1
MTTNFGIKSIPTLLFFKGEELVGKHVGAIGKQELIEKINKLL